MNHKTGIHHSVQREYYSLFLPPPVLVFTIIVTHRWRQTEAAYNMEMRRSVFASHVPADMIMLFSRE